MLNLIRRYPFIVLGMILGNILLSLWCIHSDPVMNNDGVTYLAVAEYFTNGQWAKAFDLYSLPFYSLFISITARVFSLPPEAAAYSLSTFLVTSLTLAFISIVSELSNKNKAIIIIAGLVILFFPSVNKYRAYLTRDYGYLSCYLWSVYFLLKYSYNPSKFNILGWVAFGLFSCFFRLEGIVFILLMPLLLMFWRIENKKVRRLYAVIIAGVVGLSVFLVIAWLMSNKYSSIFLQLKAPGGVNIDEIASRFFQEVFSRGNGNHVLVDFALSIWNVSYDTIRRLAVVYFFFSIYAYKNRLSLNSSLSRQIWVTYLIINFVLLCVFSVVVNFFVSRYAMALVLTLLILSPFTIHLLITKLASYNRQKRYAVYFMGLLLIAISIDGLDVGVNKDYIRKAGHWLDQHLPPDGAAYSNNKLIAYYAYRNPTQALEYAHNTPAAIKLLRTGKMYKFNYFAMQIDTNDSIQIAEFDSVKWLLGDPVYSIIDEPSAQVFIFKVKSP